MKPPAAGGIAMALAAALALLTFFQFPGHTWLQQDTQIYTAILEHLRDPSVLANDILAEKPHVAFTLYDEAARLARAATGLSFRVVLEAAQIGARALGIWGLYLIALALGLTTSEAWLVAAIVSLGATIAGPEVLTLEYEPSPRALALPLVICAIGLAGHRRFVAASLAGAAAFLLHPPTALAFWLVFLTLAAWPHLRRVAATDPRPEPFITAARLAPPAAWPAGIFLASVAVLLLAARAQAGPGESQALFARLTPGQVQLQHLRTAYTWISTWPPRLIALWLAVFALAMAAYARIRQNVPPELRAFLVGLPVLGVLSMPASWLLLERAGWSLVPQIQPLRLLLFVALSMQILAAAAGLDALRRRSHFEAGFWFVLAYLLPLEPVVTGPREWARLGLLLALAAGTVVARRYAPAVTLAAFFAIPGVGGVVNYPHLHTPELAQLSAWARTATGRDAVFVFPDAGHAVDPGIFRCEALRAVYVDWKGGGQVNFFREFGEQWWYRWQQTVARGFQPSDLPRYRGLGISYAVLNAADRLPQPPVFQNARYAVYATPAASP
ncbi:MAG TPA: hypothetical protein VME43_10620 [Bryobacteraceae bacterium]|nr:hypothetical protein [Bryobacteraceae bacterium]